MENMTAEYEDLSPVSFMELYTTLCDMEMILMYFDRWERLSEESKENLQRRLTEVQYYTGKIIDKMDDRANKMVEEIQQKPISFATLKKN